MGHACRASGRLNSLSETESAILNSVVAEEDEEGEESNSTAVGAKHMLGALCLLAWHCETLILQCRAWPSCEAFGGALCVL